jgi:hypothetical protein
MIPVKQTILHDPANGLHGNCLSAVLASLLHMPIEHVPVFTKPHTWTRDLNAWLKQFGLCYWLITPESFIDMCKHHGVSQCHHEVGGPSKRHNDVDHACVGRDGAVVFDPHPSNEGLGEVTSIGIFIALDPWRLAEKHHG